MITGDDILELLKYGERISLECKDSRNEISKFVGKIYSAFANTCGGVILLGIEMNMKPDYKCFGILLIAIKLVQIFY